MTRGIIYVAFGKEYSRLALNTLKYSRMFAQLPMAVVVNNPDDIPLFENIRAQAIYVDCKTDHNRDIKTLINLYTPFDITLYMDCDSIIHRPGIEIIFDILGDADILLQRHSTWRSHRAYYKIYQRAMLAAGIHSLPIDIMIGGFFCFKKNDTTGRMFQLWNKYWKLNGCGRDMPSLACAVKNTPDLKYNTITRNEDKIFSYGIDKKCIVVHRSGGHDLTVFGIPRHKQNKPFDRQNKDDWELTFFNQGG